MHFSRARRIRKPFASPLKEERGAALLEFAISLPLLVVFVVGIFDFSGAFNQKQKIAQAAQEGAIIAGAQPTSDFDPLPPVGAAGPYSLQTVVTAVFNSLVGSGVLPSGTCTAPGTGSAGTGLTWTYTITSCNSAYPSDNLVITINRGSVTGTGPVAICTSVMVQYPYHWRFNSVIQLLIPGATYAATTQLQEIATVHNQM